MLFYTFMLFVIQPFFSTQILKALRISKNVSTIKLPDYNCPAPMPTATQYACLKIGVRLLELIACTKGNSNNNKLYIYIDVKHLIVSSWYSELEINTQKKPVITLLWVIYTKKMYCIASCKQENVKCIDICSVPNKNRIIYCHL